MNAPIAPAAPQYRVTFAAKVRNEATGNTWNGYYNPAAPYELRTCRNDAPGRTFDEWADVLEYAAEQLPGRWTPIIPDDIANGPLRLESDVPEYDALSGEYWTRTAILEEV